MNSIPTLKIMVLGFISLLAANPALGQEKFNIAAGYGSPELLNLAMRYQMGQSQLGISAGFSSVNERDATSLGADLFIHFGNTSMLSPRRLWYGRIGVNYNTIKDYDGHYKFLLLVPRIGKDFNLSPKVGIAGDLGVSIPFSPQEEEEWYFGKTIRNNILPSLGISIFYRL